MYYKRWWMIIGLLAVATAFFIAYSPVSASKALSQTMAQRIIFAPGGTSAAVQGQIAPSDVNYWVLSAQAGQTLSASLTFASGQAILIVYGGDGNVLISDHAEVSTFSAVLPTSQDYFIIVKGNPTTSTSYTLNVTVPPLASPLPQAQRIQFAPGATAVSVNGQVAATGTDTWVLSAFAGQTLSANLAFANGQAILIVYGADGNVLLSDHAESSSFSGALPTTQDYYISVRGNPTTSTSYSLNITIPPLFTPPSANNIQFALGAISASVNGQLAATGMDRWAVSAAAGQTMTAQLTFSTGQAILIVFGADGNVLLSDHAGASAFTGFLPTTEVYYVDVRGNPTTPTSYTLTVTIPPISAQSSNRQILFALGTDTMAVQGSVAANSTDVWRLHANAGQTLVVQTVYGNATVTLNIAGADGTLLLPGASLQSTFNGVLPSSQDYLITVIGNQNVQVNYVLSVTIPARYG